MKHILPVDDVPDGLLQPIVAEPIGINSAPESWLDSTARPAGEPAGSESRNGGNQAVAEAQVGSRLQEQCGVEAGSPLAMPAGPGVDAHTGGAVSPSPVPPETSELPTVLNRAKSDCQRFDEETSALPVADQTLPEISGDPKDAVEGECREDEAGRTLNPDRIAELARVNEQLEKALADNGRAEQQLASLAEEHAAAQTDLESRRKAEAELQRATQELGQQVQDQTAELDRVSLALKAEQDALQEAAKRATELGSVEQRLRFELDEYVHKSAGIERRAVALRLEQRAFVEAEKRAAFVLDE